MAREWVWHTQINGHTNADEQVQLYTGPGTVWRVTGVVAAVSSDTSATGPLQLFGYTVSVGAAPVSAMTSGEDLPETMLHGAGIGVDPSASTWLTGTPTVELETEGRRVIGPGESVWLRLQSFSAAVEWTWFYGVRVLILLPDEAA